MNLLLIQIFNGNYTQVLQKTDDQFRAIRNVNKDTKCILINISPAKLDFSKYSFFIFDLNEENVEANYWIRKKVAMEAASSFITELKPDLVYMRYPLGDQFVFEFMQKHGNIVFEHHTIEEEELKLYPDKIYYQQETGFGPEILKRAAGIVGVTKSIRDYQIRKSGEFDKPGFIHSNGIDKNKIPYTGISKIKSPVTLLSVSSFQLWHGLDRLVEGLKNYSHPERFHIILAGEGNEKEKLKYKIKNYGLSDFFEFPGNIDVSKINELAKKTHIAIGSLAHHRIGLVDACPIKHREYSLYGLPIIFSCIDEDFTEDMPFILKVDPADSALDFEEINEFAGKIIANPQISNEIRKYAEERISWDAKAGSLIMFLEDVRKNNNQSDKKSDQKILNTKISLGIPTRNRIEPLFNLIESLKRQTFTNFELIISDDGDKFDLEKEIAKRFPGLTYKYVKGKQHSLPVNRQTILDASSNELVVMCDDDHIMDENCLYELVRTAVMNSDAGIVSAIWPAENAEKVDFEKVKGEEDYRLDFDNLNVDTHYWWRNGWKTFCVFHENPKVLESQFSGGGCVLYKKSAVKDAGGFPDYYSSVSFREDTDISHRVYLAGYKVLVNPSAVAYHHPHNTGGCRDNSETEKLRESDGKLFLQKLDEWRKEYLNSKRKRRIKIAADYAHEMDLTKIDTHSDFSTAIEAIFKEYRPLKIIETGTYLGTGTTKIISENIKNLGLQNTEFYSIEINPSHHSQAMTNITNSGLSDFVILLYGLSVPRKLLPTLEEIQKSTVEQVEYDDIFVDHYEADRALRYFEETKFEDAEEDLLGKTLKKFNYRPDFILLDSAGHMGEIEFNYLIDQLENKCIIALDDIYHIKHHKNFRRIQNDRRFEVLVYSKEKFGFCVAKFTPSSDKKKSGVSDEILWVRTDSIGDNVLASGMLPHIKNKYPDSQITVLCQDFIAELYESNPFADDIISFNKKKMINDGAYRDKFINDLKKKKYNMVLNPVFSREPLTDYISINAESENKFAFQGDLANGMSEDLRNIHNQYYTGVFETADDYKLETERNREFLSNLGISAGSISPEIYLTDEDEKFAAKFIEENGINPEKLIVLFAGVLASVRKYNGYGKAIAEALKDDTGFTIIALGNETDKNINDKNLNGIKGKTFNLSGKTTLRQAAALIKKAKLSVGAETGLAHIANAVGTKNVVLVGGGHFGRFMPYSEKTTVVCNPLECYACNWACKYSEPHCISEIDPAVLSRAVEYALKNDDNRINIFVSDQVESENKPRKLDLEKLLQNDFFTFHYPEKREILNAPGKNAEIELSVRSNSYKKHFKVSAIVSAYKSEKHIKGRLENLASQTLFKSGELEIIIVDSASPEDEKSVSLDFVKSNPNVTYLRTSKRETIYKAWNRGIEAAGGKYITNANTDDRLFPDSLEILAAKLDEQPEVVLVHGDQFSAEDTLNFDESNISYKKLWNWFPFSRLGLLGDTQVGSQPMWRKSLHEKTGLFDENLSILGDREFFIRISGEGDFLYIPEVLGARNYNEKSLSNNQVKAEKEAALIFEKYTNTKYLSELIDLKTNSGHKRSEVINDFCALYFIEILFRKGMFFPIVNVVSLLKNAVEDSQNPDILLRNLIRILTLIYQKDEIFQSMGSLERDKFDFLWKEISENPEMEFILVKGNQHEYIKKLREDYNQKYTQGKSEISKASVIIPVFNKLDYTKKCIDSIFKFTNPGIFELIVVNNASEDGTEEYLSKLAGIRKNVKIITNSENLGFAKANNQGADAAKNDVLVFLNNDTEVTESWLENLISPLQNKEIGISGAKLLFPDGRLQHAGIDIVEVEKIGLSLVPWLINYKGFENYESCNLKVMPAVTGACLAVRKEIFVKAGKFDENYWNGYEDIGLCFSVRSMGLKVVYQPASVVTHYESKSGTERFTKENENLLLLNKKWKSKEFPNKKFVNGILQEKNSAAVVVVSYNSSGSIKDCLTALKNTIKDHDEVIIVDNNSKDSTVSIVENFIQNDKRFRLIKNKENLGFSKACNLGAGASEKTFTVLLNPDTIVTESWLEKLIERFSDPRTAAAGPVSNFAAGLQNYMHYLPETLKTENDFRKIKRYLEKNHSGKNIETKLLTGFCVAFRSDVFKENGMLDEKLFLGNDDLDISWRLRLKGYKLTVAIDSFVIHEGQVSFKTVENSVTGKLVQESTDYLYSKLENHYGKGNIPVPKEIWGMNWFKPQNAVFNNENDIFNKKKSGKDVIVSVITLTYNQLEYTKQFVDSVFENFSGTGLELLIIDNNSSDGTKNYLKSLQKENNVSVIFNEENLGFPAAVNQGIRSAKGKYIIVANNDVIVTCRSIERMIELTESDPQIGIVGPVSNAVSGMQLDKNAKYSSINEMHEYAGKVSSTNRNRVLEFPRVAFLFTLIKREVIEKIGGLDERFSPGNFEDDDFCLRSQLAGFKTVIAQDVFIHHFGSKSFKAGGEKNYSDRLEINRTKFVQKWGADPDEIWLKGVKPNEKTISYPLESDEIITYFKRAKIHLAEEDLQLAQEALQKCIREFNSKGISEHEGLKVSDVMNLKLKLDSILEKVKV